MPACTFFGHRDCPDSVYPTLLDTIEGLILSNGVDRFYVGHQGHFDALALKALRELKKQHPEIAYHVVLAYLPQRPLPYDPEETLYPEGLETVPPRFAISRRNDWMLDRAEYAITYVVSPAGGAAKAKQNAMRLKKVVIELQ